MDSSTVVGADGASAIVAESPEQGAVGTEGDAAHAAPRVLGPSCIKHERVEWSLRKDEATVGNELHELRGALQHAIMYKGIKEVEGIIRAGAPLGAEYPLNEDANDVGFGTALDLMMIHKRFKLALGALDLDTSQFAQGASGQPEALCDAAVPEAVVDEGTQQQQAVDAPDVGATGNVVATDGEVSELVQDEQNAALAIGTSADDKPAEKNDAAPDDATTLAERQNSEQVRRLADESAIQNVDCSLSIGERLARDSTRAFVLAVRDGKEQILQKLLDLKASLSQFDKDGRSALLLAATRGRKSCVNILINEGAESIETRLDEVRQWMEHFQMHVSEQSLQDDKIALAAQTAAEQNISLAAQTERRWANTPHERQSWSLDDDAKQGPLAYAITNQGIKEVKMAIQQGASLVGEYPLVGIDRPMGTALDLALQHRRFQLAGLLLKEAQGEALAKQSSFSLAWAALENRVEIVQELLRLGADASQCDEFGRSALLLSVTRGHRQCVDLLVASNAWNGEKEQNAVREWAVHWKLTTFMH